MSVLSMLFAILNLYASSKAICIHRYSRTGQPHPLFSNLQKQNCIVSFSYYFQFNYTWMWYNITTLVTLSILNSRLKNPFSWNFEKVCAKHQPINQSINRFIKIFNACFPSLADDVSCISTSPKTLQCILGVCSDYSRKWCFRFNVKQILHITVLTKPTREKPDV
jgi:hypothetical protein